MATAEIHRFNDRFDYREIAFDFAGDASIEEGGPDSKNPTDAKIQQDAMLKS